MKPHIRELITDLKAALRLRHPDALADALDGIRATPDDLLPPNALVPLGSALLTATPDQLQPLLTDDDPAIRGITAVALALRFAAAQHVDADALAYAADDPQADVRAAFATALRTTTDAARLRALILPWLVLETPNMLDTALQTVPACFDFALADAFAPLHLAPDHDIRQALVNALNQIATAGKAAWVLELVGIWAQADEPNVWVITRVLSASWAQDHHENALRALNMLAERVGEIRPVTRAKAYHL